MAYIFHNVTYDHLRRVKNVTIHRDTYFHAFYVDYDSHVLNIPIWDEIYIKENFTLQPNDNEGWVPIFKPGLVSPGYTFF